MTYHKVTKQDCLSVATSTEKVRLSLILDMGLLKRLALKWCQNNKYRLYGYIGNESWDSSKEGLTNE